MAGGDLEHLTQRLAIIEHRIDRMERMESQQEQNTTGIAVIREEIRQLQVLLNEIRDGVTEAQQSLRNNEAQWRRIVWTSTGIAIAGGALWAVISRMPPVATGGLI